MLPMTPRGRLSELREKMKGMSAGEIILLFEEISDDMSSGFSRETYVALPWRDWRTDERFDNLAQFNKFFQEDLWPRFLRSLPSQDDLIKIISDKRGRIDERIRIKAWKELLKTRPSNEALIDLVGVTLVRSRVVKLIIENHPTNKILLHGIKESGDEKIVFWEKLIKNNPTICDLKAVMSIEFDRSGLYDLKIQSEARKLLKKYGVIAQKIEIMVFVEI